MPASSYLRFVANYKQQNGLKGGQETLKKAGSAWKVLNPVQKAPFEQAALKEREVYHKAFNLYKESGKLDAWKRDPAMPKKPTPAFFAWAIEQRKAPRFANVKPADVAKLLKPEWEVLPAIQKDALQRKYKTELDSFKKKMEEYKASGAKETWLAQTGRLDKIQKEEAKKAAEKEKADKKKVLAAERKQKIKAKEADKKAKAAAAKEKLKAKEAEGKAKEKEKLAKEKEKLAKEKEKEKEKLAKEQGESKGKGEEAQAEKLAKEKEKLAKEKEKEKKKLAKEQGESKGKGEEAQAKKEK